MERIMKVPSFFLLLTPHFSSQTKKVNFLASLCDPGTHRTALSDSVYLLWAGTNSILVRKAYALLFLFTKELKLREH